MNRLAILRKAAKKLRLPKHCTAEAKRSASDALEIQVRYVHNGKQFFVVQCFLDESSEGRFRADLLQVPELANTMRYAIKRGLPA